MTNTKMNCTTQFHDIVEFLFPEYIGIGTAMRLRRTSITIYKAIDLNYPAWYSFFKTVKMKWLKSFKDRFDTDKTMWYLDKNGLPARKKSFSTLVLQEYLPLAKRCRECGQTNGLNTMYFYICSDCAADPGGYSQLVSSQDVRQIVSDAGNGWRRKLPSNFCAYSPPLKVVRRTVPFKKRLYWASDAYALKKKYEDKKKNVEHKYNNFRKSKRIHIKQI